jgi:hypothetical protein
MQPTIIYFAQNTRYAYKIYITNRDWIKMAVFWDIAPCSLVDNDRGFRRAYCLTPSLGRFADGMTGRNTDTLTCTLYATLHFEV